MADTPFYGSINDFSSIDPEMLRRLQLGPFSTNIGANPYAGTVPNNALQSLEDFNYRNQYNSIGKIDPPGDNNWFDKLFSKSGMNAFGSGAQGIASLYGIWDSIQKRRLMEESMDMKRNIYQNQADNMKAWHDSYTRPRTMVAGRMGGINYNIPKMKKLQLA